MENRIEQRSDTAFVWIDKFAYKSSIVKSKFVEVLSKHGGVKIPRSIAGEQFVNAVGKIVDVVADSSVPDQLSDNGVSVDVS